MDARDLKTFETVARLQSMSRAAAELNTVQSNVTARIRQLEHQFGTALFERHSRGVTLTPAGQRVLPYARRLAQLLGEAAQAARDDGEPKGPLTLGTLETTMALRLSPVLASYAETYPDVDLTLRTGTTCELLDGVLEGRLEGAYVCGPVSHPELDQEPVFEEELVVLTGPRIKSVDDLINGGNTKIVVLRSGCSYRQMLEMILARRGVVGLRCLEFGNWESIFSAVAAGIGTTLLPKAMIGPIWREGQVTMHRLPAKEGMVQTVFARRHDAYMSSAMRAFLEIARGNVPHLVAAE